MLKYAFAEIVKFEENSEGDLMVEGLAASPRLDLDRQRMGADFLKSAMPEWAEWSNVRAMHGNVAAGVGAELSETKPGHWLLKALIVDEDSKNKVRKGVYKGFSVGIKHARVQPHSSAPKGMIVGGEIVEISLVDRPANPDSFINICKSAGGGLFVPGTVTNKWLSADVHKAALATAEDILAGDYEDDGTLDVAKGTILELADVAIAELMTLRESDLDGPVDIGNVFKTVDALRYFVDEDEEGMQETFDGLTEADLLKAAGGNVGGDATVIAAEMVKAAVAKATGPFMERIASLEGQLAEVKARPVPGGPVLYAPNTPMIQKSANAGRFASQASNPNLDPALRAGYAELAAEEEGSSR